MGFQKWTEFALVQWIAILAVGGNGMDVSVFLLKYLVCETFLWFLWRSCSLADFSLWKMVLWKEKFLILHHAILKIISLLFCWVHIQDRLPLGMELMISLIFDRYLIETIDLCFYECVDVYLVQYVCVDIYLIHSGCEIYCQFFCW